MIDVDSLPPSHLVKRTCKNTRIGISKVMALDLKQIIICGTPDVNVSDSPTIQMNLLCDREPFVAILLVYKLR